MKVTVFLHNMSAGPIHSTDIMKSFGAVSTEVVTYNTVHVLGPFCYHYFYDDGRKFLVRTGFHLYSWSKKYQCTLHMNHSDASGKYWWKTAWTTGATDQRKSPSPTWAILMEERVQYLSIRVRDLLLLMVWIFQLASKSPTMYYPLILLYHVWHSSNI